MRLLPALISSTRSEEFFKLITTHSGKDKVVNVSINKQTGFPCSVVETNRLENSGIQSNREERTVYATKLIEAVTKLLFMPGFTVYDDKYTESSLWAGVMVKAATKKMAEQRILALEALTAVIYCGEYFSKYTLINPFILYLSGLNLAKSMWDRRLILTLLNTGLKIRENGYLPYVSHLYLQENETRSSVLALSLLSILITREHKIDQVVQALETNEYVQLIVATIGEEITISGKEFPSIDEVIIDHLTKYISLYDEVGAITPWLQSLYSNIRNPLDYSNTILPGSMKKVVSPLPRPNCSKRASSC